MMYIVFIVFVGLLCFFPQPYAVHAQTYTFSPVVDGYVIECSATQSGPWEECGRIPVPVPVWVAPVGSLPCKRVRSYQGEFMSEASSNIHCPLIPPPDITPVPEEPPPLPVINLLANGDIETSEWVRGSYAGTSPIFTWSTEAHSGTHALKMSGSGYQYGYWESSSVAMMPGMIYRLSLWVRLTQVKAFSVRVSWRDAQDHQVSVPLVFQVAGTQGWKEHLAEIRLPVGAVAGRIHLRCEGTNPICEVDDVKVTLFQ